MRPSGRDLTRLIAHALSDLGPDDWIVELGGGTGAVTRAMLDAGIAPGRIIVVERDPDLAAWLRKSFSSVMVVTGDAGALRELLGACNAGRIGKVVSSLPLLSIPRSDRTTILREIFSVLDDDGALIQYSYGPTCPVSRALRSELGLTARSLGTAWRNLPPARVWELKGSKLKHAARPHRTKAA